MFDWRDCGTSKVNYTCVYGWYLFGLKLYQIMVSKLKNYIQKPWLIRSEKLYSHWEYFFFGFMPQTFWAKPIYFCKNMQNRLHPASFEIWCSSSFESSTTTITTVKWFNFLFIYPSIHPSIRFFPIRLPFSFPLIFLSIISISIVVFQATFISFAMLKLIHKINLSLMQSKSCQFTCIHAHNSFYWISIGPRESILIW